MQFALPLYLTAFGLGAWALPGSVCAFGLQWYLGFLSIPICLFLLNVALRLPIPIASWLTVGVAVVGVVRRGRRGAERGRLVEMLLHPVVVLPVLYGLLTLWLQPPPYAPSEWDEFSWWLLQPRQILLIGGPASRALPVPFFARYTPGWPHLLAFPFALSGTPLITDSLRWLPFLSAVGVLGAAYDLVRLRLPAFAQRRDLAWLVVASLVALPMGITIAPPNLLIEAPLSHTWAVLVALALASGRGAGASAPVFVRAAAILCAGGYLLKEPLIVLAPLATAVAAGAVQRVRLGAALAVLLPTLLAAAVWRAATHWVKMPMNAAGPPPPTLGAVMLEVAGLATGTGLPVTLAHAGLLALFVVIATRAASRLALAGIAASMGCYLGGLLWLYVAGHFGAEQKGITPSLGRYAGIVGDTLAYAAAGLCAAVVAWRLRTYPRLSACLLIALGGVGLARLEAGVRDVCGLNRLGARKAALVGTARQVRDALARQSQSVPRLVALTADPAVGRFLAPMLRYVSLEGGGWPAFEVVGRPIILFTADNRHLRFARVLAPQAFKRQLRRADGVWIDSGSPWLLPILRRVTSNPDCVGDGVLLLRGRQRGSRAFRCTPTV